MRWHACRAPGGVADAARGVGLGHYPPSIAGIGCRRRGREAVRYSTAIIRPDADVPACRRRCDRQGSREPCIDSWTGRRAGRRHRRLLLPAASSALDSLTYATWRRASASFHPLCWAPRPTASARGARIAVDARQRSVPPRVGGPEEGLCTCPGSTNLGPCRTGRTSELRALRNWRALCVSDSTRADPSGKIGAGTLTAGGTAKAASLISSRACHVYENRVEATG